MVIKKNVGPDKIAAAGCGGGVVALHITDEEGLLRRDLPESHQPLEEQRVRFPAGAAGGDIVGADLDRAGDGAEAGGRLHGVRDHLPGQSLGQVTAGDPRLVAGDAQGLPTSVGRAPLDPGQGLPHPGEEFPLAGLVGADLARDRAASQSAVSVEDDQVVFHLGMGNGE